MEKSAATLYRGMGASYIPSALKEGLSEGTFAQRKGESSINAIKFARKYARKQAPQNLMETSLRYGDKNPAAYNKARLILNELGIGNTLGGGNNLAPLNRSMKGGVIKINIPDKEISTFMTPGVYPGEYKTIKAIPKKYLSTFKKTYQPSLDIPPPHIGRLSKKEMRIVNSLIKKGKGNDVANILKKRSPYSKAPLESLKGAMKIFKKQRLKKLLKLL